VQVTVNGEARQIPDGSSIADLVESLGLAGRRLAIEHNREIRPVRDWAATTLGEGDVVEIVHFVGGG